MECKHIIVYFKDKEERKTFKQTWRKIPNKSEYIKQIVKEYKKEITNQENTENALKIKLNLFR